MTAALSLFSISSEEVEEGFVRDAAMTEVPVPGDV